MVRLSKISLYQLPELIAISYNGDKELLERFHIAPMDLKTAIETTFGMICNASKLKKVVLYKVMFKNQPIGYAATYDEGEFLYSYAIAPQYRKKDILIEWWNKLKSLLKKEFATMIYSWNFRAISFLKKQGLQLISEDKETKILTFINTQ